MIPEVREHSQTQMSSSSMQEPPSSSSPPPGLTRRRTSTSSQGSSSTSSSLASSRSNTIDSSSNSNNNNNTRNNGRNNVRVGLVLASSLLLSSSCLYLASNVSTSAAAATTGAARTITTATATTTSTLNLPPPSKMIQRYKRALVAAAAEAPSLEEDSRSQDFLSFDWDDSIQQVLLGPTHFIDHNEHDDDQHHPILCHLQNVWAQLLLDEEDLQDHCQTGVVADTDTITGTITDTSSTDTDNTYKPQHEHTPLTVRGGGVGGRSSNKSKHKDNDTTNSDNNDQYTFSLFQKGDGSESDPDGIPTRYIQMHKQGRRDLAKQSLNATLEWRKEHSIDSILAEPQIKFQVCKSVFPHFFVGRSKSSNHVIFVQRPALIDIPKADRNNLSKQDLLRHYIYVNEFLWQIMEQQQPLGIMISVIDLTGLQWSVLRQRDILQFLQIFVTTMDLHYPSRAHKTLLINAPKWFSMLYKLLQPFLREGTKSKIVISTNGPLQDEILKRELFGNDYSADDDSGIALPDEFWSTPTTTTETKQDGANERMSQAVLERELESFVMERLQESGKQMQKVVE